MCLRPGNRIPSREKPLLQRREWLVPPLHRNRSTVFLKDVCGSRLTRARLPASLIAGATQFRRRARKIFGSQDRISGWIQPHRRKTRFAPAGPLPANRHQECRRATRNHPASRLCLWSCSRPSSDAPAGYPSRSFRRAAMCAPGLSSSRRISGAMHSRLREPPRWKPRRLRSSRVQSHVAPVFQDVVKGSERAEHRVRAAKPQNQLQLRPRVRSTPEEPECTRPRLRCFLQPRSADVRQPFAARKSAGLWQITLSQRH